MLIVSFIVNTSTSQRVSENKWVAQRGMRVRAGTWSWSPSSQVGVEPTSRCVILAKEVITRIWISPQGTQQAAK